MRLIILYQIYQEDTIIETAEKNIVFIFSGKACPRGRGG